MNELLTIPQNAIDTLQSVEADAKLAHPHAHFAHPTDVVVDPNLTKVGKPRRFCFPKTIPARIF